MVDGAIRVVHPHPNFRLFLTMNPRHGAISRAMRNRGVEICLPELVPGSPDALILLAAQLQKHTAADAPLPALRPPPAAGVRPLSRRVGYECLERLQEWHCTYTNVFHRVYEAQVHTFVPLMNLRFNRLCVGHCDAVVCQAEG